MKTKFGTALALAAVLLTGTAAAAINTQALTSPTKSTLGTASTTLLPPVQLVAVDPAQGTNTGVAPSQTQSSATASPDQAANPTATIGGSVANQPATTVTSAPSSPSVSYGNPNPSNGDDDEDDEDDEDDDEEYGDNDGDDD